MTYRTTAWMEDADCRNHPGFTDYPADRAHRICTKCPVLDQCRAYADQFPDWSSKVPIAGRGGRRPTGRPSLPRIPCTVDGCTTRTTNLDGICRAHQPGGWNANFKPNPVKPGTVCIDSECTTRTTHPTGVCAVHRRARTRCTYRGCLTRTTREDGICRDHSHLQAVA